MPSLAETILAISTSKPSGLPSRPLRPKSGWSNFVPTRTVPAAASLAIVEPSGKLAAVATGGALAPDEPSVVCWPHAARARPPARITAASLWNDMRRSSLMREDLPEEVLRAIRTGLGEERVGRGVLDDLAVGHEHHAVGGPAGEAHLVGHHEHRHALLRQRGHHVEDLLDHLGVER